MPGAVARLADRHGHRPSHGTLRVELRASGRIPKDGDGGAQLRHALGIGRVTVGMGAAREGAIGSLDDDQLGCWIDLEHGIRVALLGHGMGISPRTRWSIQYGTGRPFR